MKFFVDAHLPRRVARLLTKVGHDAMHTLDLPNGNLTSDTEIINTANAEGRIVITKDADFVDSFLLFRRPQTLLLISTGNIRNAELQSLLVSNIYAIETAFQTYFYVELSRTSLTIHT